MSTDLHGPGLRTKSGCLGLEQMPRNSGPEGQYSHCRGRQTPEPALNPQEKPRRGDTGIGLNPAVWD